MRVFGKASDFYRLRVIKVSEDSELDLEWEDDILYKAPPISPMTTRIWYLVQAIAVDDESAHGLKRFRSGDAAMRFKDKVEEFLRELTKQEFEDRFPRITT